MTHKPTRRKNAGRATPIVSNARQMALSILDEHRRTSEYASRILDQRFRDSSSGNLSPADRNLATELVYGIVRRKLTLDAIIEPHVSRPRHQVEPELWTLLQLGAYQLVFLTSIPAHAAVHETVELTRWLGKPRGSSFVNGVLRSIQRGLTDSFTDEPTGMAIPIANSSDRRNYRCLTTNVFSDPEQDPCGYFTKAFGFPLWLTERWFDRFGFDELLGLGFWLNSPASIVLRVNRLRNTREEFINQLNTFTTESIGIVIATAGTHDNAVRIQGNTRITELPGFHEGLFSVQDETAMAVASLLAPKPNQRVWDMCAAPGTKTIHLAEIMENQGHILATDISSERLKRVTENAERMGISIIETQTVSNGGANPRGPFDAILVDVPCSNTGVLGKRPEARWRVSRDGLEELQGIQTKLLSLALSRLQPGGRVVYSTCSIEPEENEHVVQHVLKETDQVELLSSQLSLPSPAHDGGFQALLQRR